MAGITEPTRTGFGTLGLHVGAAGRWIRLAYGLLILIPLLADLADDFNLSGAGLGFFGRLALYFGGITATYALVYWLLGRHLLGQVSPWITTLIFVGPALLVAWWGPLLRPLTGIDLPTSFVVAMALYIGVSLLLQWRIRYGGCEVVAIPILLTGRRFPSYCIPLVAVDAIEKAVIDRRARGRAQSADKW